MIENQHFGRAEPSNILAWASLILTKLIYPHEYYILPAIVLFINNYPYTTAHKSPIIFLSVNIPVKQYIKPGQNTLTQSVLHFLVSLIPACVHCTDSHQPLFSLCHWPPCWWNQSRSMWWALTSWYSGLSEPLKPLPSSILDSSSASQSSLLLFGLSKSPFLITPCLVLETISGVLSSSLSAGWHSILLIRRMFDTWVHLPGRSFADNAGGKGDHCNTLYVAIRTCGHFIQDALMISSVSEMYALGVICMFWVQDSFLVACRFWLPCHTSKWHRPLPFCAFIFPQPGCSIPSRYQFQVVSNAAQLVVNVPWLAQAHCITTTFSLECLGSGFRLSPANNVSAKRSTGLHSNSMWYNWEYDARHIREIGVLWEYFLGLQPPVGDIWQPKSSVILHGVGMVISNIWIYLPPVLW